MKRLLAASALSLLASGAAAAQDSAPIALEPIPIEGEVQKPEITVFITRQNLDAGYELKLRESFVPRIVKSLDRGPF